MKIRKLDIVRINDNNINKLLAIHSNVWTKLIDNVYLFCGDWELDLESVKVITNVKELLELYNYEDQLIEERRNKTKK